MSHLPPRPDYDHAPPRYDSHPHAPPAAMGQEHGYPPPRDRDSYSRRTPPLRSRHPPDRVADSYVAADSYIPRDAYAPSGSSRYDRGDSERYSREPRYERREREYSPRAPPSPRGYRGDTRERTRDEPRPPYGRSRPDPRAWTRRGDDDRRRDRRRDGYGDDRDKPYLSRRSMSPPRTYSSHPGPRREPSISSARPRSPIRRRTPSPGEWSPSPTRSVSPLKSRLGPPPSPRYRGGDNDRFVTRPTETRSLRRKSRSRSRSAMRASPARSARSPRRRPHSRSRSPVRQRERSTSTGRKPVNVRPRSPTPPKVIESRPQPDSGLAKEPQNPPRSVEDKLATRPPAEQRPIPQTPPTETKAEPEKQHPPQKELEVKSERAAEKAPAKPAELGLVVEKPFEEPLWRPEDVLNVDKDGIPLIEKRGILLPDSYWSYVSGRKSAPEPPPIHSDGGSEEQVPLDPVVEVMQDMLAHYAPTPASVLLGPRSKGLPKDMELATAEEDSQYTNFDIPAYESWYDTPSYSVEEFFKRVYPPVDALYQRRSHLESERFKLWAESNQALLDLETVLLDVRAAERKRKIAEAQLELALEGRLGSDYDHSRPWIADTLDAANSKS